MPYPESGGDTRIRITSTGSFVNPQVGDIWTIKLGRNIAASDFSMIQTRNGTPTSLALVGMTHTVDANDKPAIGGSWPLIANANGLSLSSTPINVTNPATVPAAPTMGTATAGNATATVPYTDGGNGGSAIISHDMQVYDGAGNLIGTITGVANPAVLTSAQGIINGNSYMFKARAVNAVGPGPYAAAFSNTVTPVNVEYLRFYTENAHGTVANPAMVAFGNNNRVSASIYNRSNWPVQTAAQAFGPNSNLNPFLGTYDDLPPGKKNTYTTEKGFVWLRCKRLANSSITVSGNTATVVFAAPIVAPVTVSPGDLIVFESVTPAGFNTTWPVASVIDASTITIDVTGKSLTTATVAGNYFGRANRNLFVEIKEQR